MNFFEHQEMARKKTGRLIFYFILSVLSIIIAVYFAAAGIFLYSADNVTFWDPSLFIAVAVGTFLLVGGGSLYKTSALAAGGKVVAESLGGRIVSSPRDPDEKKLMNVVHEMAIASGTPVPTVYIMDQEAGINAFAAGFTSGDAVIGVTRGAIEQLSRGELQGVIAHEFSHILNGDMRMNIRLIGILHGILMISLLGYWMFRITAHSGRGSREKGGGAAAFVLLGIALMIIGYVGVFFGNMIKSAVSRQREFLADASAVQFTRYPDGLAGALKKIAGIGSRIASPHAQEASHMFFSNGLGAALFATHPPLDERISRILGREIKIAPSVMGQPQTEHIAYAHTMVKAMSAPMARALEDPLSAVATVYALLLHDDATVETRQLEWIRGHSDPALYQEISKVRPSVRAGGKEKRLITLDLAIPALRLLSKSQTEEFRAGIQRLIEADDELSLFEFALQRVLLHHLDEKHPNVLYTNFNAVAGEALVLLSATAHMGHYEAERVSQGFRKGLRHLGTEAAILPLGECSFAAIDTALEKFVQAAPLLKQKLIEALLDCAGIDEFITVEEYEIIRAIADSIDVALPPMTPGTETATAS